MSEVDYNKVEKLLVEAILKMWIERIHQLADRVAEGDVGALSEGTRTISKEASRKAIMARLKSDLKKMMQKDRGMMGKTGLTGSELKKYIDDPASLSPEEWQKIKEIKDRLDAQKEGMLEEMERDMNQELVVKERKRHIYKRFNVRDGWLPMH